MYFFFINHINKLILLESLCISPSVIQQLSNRIYGHLLVVVVIVVQLQNPFSDIFISGILNSGISKSAILKSGILKSGILKSEIVQSETFQ